MINGMIDKHIDNMKNDIRKSDSSTYSKNRQLRHVEALRYNMKSSMSEGGPVLVGWVASKIMVKISDMIVKRKLRDELDIK